MMPDSPFIRNLSSRMGFSEMTGAHEGLYGKNWQKDYEAYFQRQHDLNPAGAIL
jgi:hypothetical protein